jgi:simple sugar transport system ATP-binding protein
VLKVQNISKRFGALQALSDVSITFKAGEVHAVLGENGAGKSTLMNVIGGFLRPDSGLITLDENPWPLGDPEACRRAGLGMIHQHFTLVPPFTVEENLALARLPRLAAGLNLSELSRPALELADRLKWPVDPSAPVSSLPVGVQQRIEILKALGDRERVLLFDEPTAPLSPAEVSDLLRVLRQLAEEGRIVILIAHKLAEVLEVSDTISVLRRGKLVWSSPREGVTAEQLAKEMVGEMPPARVFTAQTLGAPVVKALDLQAKDDRGADALRGISFEIREGEILGFGGVDGNGQVELAETLAGVRPVFGGTLEAPIAGYVPGDRQGEGLAMGLSVGENLMLGAVRRPQLLGSFLLALRRLREWSLKLIRDYAIKAEGPRSTIAGLSGGNQQKVVVSRTLDAEPKLIVAVNPTRGLDIRAAEFVHEQLRTARSKGAAIALISADLDELAALSDRTVYLSRGELFEGDSALAVVGSR